MIGKITSDIASKIKNTDWQKIRHSLNPIATNSHLEGAFSSTGDSLLIRKISKLEQEGNFDKIKSISSKLYERMLKMDEEFKKLPPVIFAQKYYRGIMGENNEGVKILQKANQGDIVMPDRGYAFITKSKDVADSYARYLDNSAGGENVFMEIKIPRGAKISRNPFHLREAVMPRNAKFKVLDKQEQEGLTKVILKYIPSK